MQKEVQELLHELELNSLAWGLFFCPKHFTVPSPFFHLEMLDAVHKYRWVAIASPRESSKSTLLTFLYPIHSVSFKKRRFIVLVQNTYAKACGSLNTIKEEIRNNKRVGEFYRMSFEKDSEGDTVIVHPDGFKTRVLCKGHEQIGSVRGEKFGPYRPDLIIGDDMEDDVMVRSRERRENLKNEFDDALIPAGDAALCQYVFVGTLLHDDSLMSKLVSKNYYPEYKKYLYRALNIKNGKEISLWKEKWSLERLKQIQAEKPSVFAKEYQNDPVAGAMGKFSKDDFRYWTVENNEAVLFDNESRIIAKHPLHTCKAAIACDLAWEEKREADFSVILPGFLTPTSDILLESYICKKGMRPYEMEEVLFSMEERLRLLTGGSVPIGLEKAKLEKVMRWWLQQAMRRRNRYLILKDLIWDTDKIQRITTRLEPRYAQHAIFHRRGMGELEHQLTRFPSGVHDDLADAAQGLCQILQHPKHGKKVTPKDDTEFQWWLDMAHKSLKKPKETYIFGKKGKKVEIPATPSFR